uniref:Carboxylic ester hydrolase n=1 Tax=Panagrolaimus sp. PS1159 TaxID=55785 RepID=A0AC35FIK6_9BILA
MKFLMLHYFALLLILGSAFATFSVPRLPIVRIPEYTATGFKNVTAKGTEANIYLGLPYVKPPVRFEKAEPLKPSLTKFIQAKTWPNACHQVIDVSPVLNTSEDCLYLNVFTPAKISLKLLPVLIFIHGGGYAYGYSQAYGFEYLVDNFIPQDIIVVTLQYRIAHFGFFATRDHVINGNFAHFDQLEALKFIKRNIIAFGGDPNQITLSGHSAGSTSTHALSLSPQTKNLYNQEIHLAGSNYALWGIASESVYNHSEIISNAVGCNQTDTHERKTCLQKVDYKKFWEVRKDLNFYDFVPDKIDMLYWSANFDDDFFQGKTLDELQSVAPKRKTLYGVDFGEGVLETLVTQNPITNVFSIARGGFAYENRSQANAETIRGVILQMLVDPKFDNATKEVIIGRIFEFYEIGVGANATDPLHYYYKLSELYNIILKTAIGIEIEAKYDLGWTDQYMFQFKYVRPQDIPQMGNLPGHGYFLLYFCGLEIYLSNGISHTAEDNLVQNNLAQVFYNFVKGQSPASNGVSIPKVTATSIPYMLVGKNVVIEDTDIKPKVDFWKQLSADYQYDLLRQIHL